MIRSRASAPAGEATRADKRLLGLVGAVERDCHGREVSVLLIAVAMWGDRDRARRAAQQLLRDAAR